MTAVDNPVTLRRFSSGFRGTRFLCRSFGWTWLGLKNGRVRGIFMIFENLKEEVPEMCRNSLQISAIKFQPTKVLVELLIKTHDTNYRQASISKLKLEITLCLFYVYSIQVWLHTIMFCLHPDYGCWTRASPVMCFDFYNTIYVLIKTVTCFSERAGFSINS